MANNDGTNNGTNDGPVLGPVEKFTEDPRKLIKDARELADQKLKSLQDELKAREQVLQKIKEQGIAEADIASKASYAAAEAAIAQERLIKER